jgi:hypothetical protein
VDIAPNPAPDHATITVSGLTATASYSITGLDGRPVSSGIIEPGRDGVARKTIDVAGFAKGTYLVSIDCGIKTLTSKLVIR